MSYYIDEMKNPNTKSSSIRKAQQFMASHMKEEIEKEYSELGSLEELCKKYDLQYASAMAMLRILGIKCKQYNPKTHSSTNKNWIEIRNQDRFEKLLNSLIEKHTQQSPAFKQG